MALVSDIIDMGKEAALNPSAVDDLSDRIRKKVDTNEFSLSESQIEGLKARSWREAVKEVVEEGAFSFENQYALNLYRKRFGPATGDEAHEAYFDVLRLMTMLKSLSHDRVVPRFDHSAYAMRFGRLSFNLMRHEELVWVFRDVAYLQLVTRLKTRFLLSDQYLSSMEQADTGILGITTKHIYFVGFSEVFRVGLDELISTKQYGDGFGITRDSPGATPEAFTMEYPDSWFPIKFMDAILDMEDMTLPDRDSPTLENFMDKRDSSVS